MEKLLLLVMAAVLTVICSAQDLESSFELTGDKNNA